MIEAIDTAFPFPEDLCTEEETVFVLILSLPHNTSPGPDGIPSILLKTQLNSLLTP